MNTLVSILMLGCISITQTFAATPVELAEQTSTNILAMSETGMVIAYKQLDKKIHTLAYIYAKDSFQYDRIKELDEFWFVLGTLLNLEHDTLLAKTAYVCLEGGKGFDRRKSDCIVRE